MTKPGRNDPCPCGSGKKFKKCCESTLAYGKFRATKVSATDATPSRLTGLFFSHVPEVVSPPTSINFEASTEPPPKPPTPSEPTPEKGIEEKEES